MRNWLVDGNALTEIASVRRRVRLLKPQTEIQKERHVLSLVKTHGVLPDYTTTRHTIRDKRDLNPTSVLSLLNNDWHCPPGQP